MKNILLLLSIVVFVVGLFLLADTKIEYALIAIVTSCALVLSSCLIEKEEENMILKQQLVDHTLRGTHTALYVGNVTRPYGR